MWLICCPGVYDTVLRFADPTFEIELHLLRMVEFNAVAELL